MTGIERRIPLPDHVPSPREPDAVCDRCGALGTVARTLPTVSADPASFVAERLCAPCWPTARAALEDHAHAWVSRTWSDAQTLLALYRSAADDPQLTPAVYAALCAELRALAEDIDGPMPADVALFLRQHGSPAV